MKSSYFVPKEKLAGCVKGVAMNTQEGVYLFGVADPGVKKLLPPPLELPDPDMPLFYFYCVDIREPTFAPWYMEGGIGVIAKYGETIGMYFFSLMLSGPGALMGAYVGGQGYGLPKKLCERIALQRTDEYGRCSIERNGVRLAEAEFEIGKYNNPSFGQPQENCANTPGGITLDGVCLGHRVKMDGGFKDIELMSTDSPTHYDTWEPATATLKLASSMDDPWGEINVVTVLGAAWSKCDNSLRDTSVLYRYPEDEAGEAMRYLFTGRYDRSLLCCSHQRYENI